MKQLSLNNLGVQELDAKEMVETDGGGWAVLGAFLVAGLAWELLTEGPEECWNDFVNGFNNTQ